MKKKWDLYLPRSLAMPLFLVLSFCCIFKSTAQDCPQLLSPFDGDVQVSVNSSISWESVVGVPGYILSLGTTPGGIDLLNAQNVGASNQYTPTFSLPENSKIFVTISLLFFNQQNIVCDSQSFTTATLSEAPGCTSLNSPINNAINSNTATNIVWDLAPFAEGYFLTIGTTLNGGEIIAMIDVGNTLLYNPSFDFPAASEIFVTVIPYNRIGLAIGCLTSMFTTASLAVLPTCTGLISPFNGETNVLLSPTLTWNEVSNATGYRVSIGTSPFENNILNSALFFKTSTLVIDFESNRTFFVSIIPFNDAGEAIGCSQETFSTLIGCGPYYDPISGELVVLNPKMTFPDTVGICLNRNSNIILATDQADGYRWFKVEINGTEVLLSTEPEIVISEAGVYRHEIYTTFEDSGGNFECSSSKIFQVEESEAAIIENILITQQGNKRDFEIKVTGVGSYEFALDNENGLYQDSNKFSSVPAGNHTIIVRDKLGCGISREVVEQDVTVEGFPKFFTPNGDGTNDFWQFIPPVETNENSVLSIRIFDKFGTFLAQIEPNSIGWNGRLNGRPLPEANYWFRAVFKEAKEIKGYFSLKR